AADTPRYHAACTRYTSERNGVVPAMAAATIWSDVGPAAAVLSGERTPAGSGDSDETWKSSRRPAAGTAPPFAVGIDSPETTLTPPCLVASGASADFKS